MTTSRGRFVDWRIRLEDTVADNGSSAFVILGSQRVRPRDVDLRGLLTVLEVDGVEVETGEPAMMPPRKLERSNASKSG